MYSIVYPVCVYPIAGIHRHSMGGWPRWLGLHSVVQVQGMTMSGIYKENNQKVYFSASWHGGGGARIEQKKEERRNPDIA